MSVFDLSSDRTEHVLHSPIFPKINMHVSFSFIELRLCYYLFIKTHLSINEFTNLISRNAWAPETKSTYIVFCHSNILSVQLSSS